MKKYLYLLLICICLASCKSTSVSKSKPTKESNNKEISTNLITKIIKTAKDNIGVRYKTAGTTQDGFDCSGLVQYSFLKHEIILPRSSFEMATIGDKIKKEEAQKGDLIFFKTNGKSIINHVGLIVEINGNEIKFIHSSNQKGVLISSTTENYYAKSFAQVNRILIPN